MSLSKETGNSGFYTMSSGPFKGLFTALPPSAIGDNYLALGTKNVTIDNLGILHATLKPGPLTEGVAMYAPPGVVGTHYPIVAIDYTSDTRLFVSFLPVGSVVSIYKEGPSSGTLVYAKHSGTNTPIVYDFKYFTTDLGIGLYDLSDNKVMTDAMHNMEPASSGYGLTIDQGRLWFSGQGKTISGVIAPSCIRGSDVTDPSLTSSWVIPADAAAGSAPLNEAIFQTIPASAIILHLVSMINGLYIIAQNGIWYQSAFTGNPSSTGVLRQGYSGQDVPNLGSTIFTNGKTMYWGTHNGLFQFALTRSGFIMQKISTLLDDAAFAQAYTQIYVSSFANRLWFLVIDGTANLIYTLNQLTGAWEVFDLTNIGGHTVDLPTCLSSNKGIFDVLLIGTSYAEIYGFGHAFAGSNIVTPTTTYLPWTIMSKEYVPTLSYPHSPKHVSIDYIGQLVSSPVTVTFYVDGTALTTTKTFDMQGNARLTRKQLDIPLVAPQSANSLQMKITGSGPMQITNISYTFHPRDIEMHRE